MASNKRKAGLQLDKVCFVVSPIGAADSPVRKHADAVLEKIIRPGLAGFGYRANRFDKSGAAGRITEKMVRLLRECPLCIGALTGLNPNVMYEVGVRHAWDLPIVLLAEEGTVLPFDLKDCNTVYYSLAPARARKAVQDLRQQIDEIHNEVRTADKRNPVQMQGVFFEGMRILSQTRSLQALFRTKEAILEFLVDQMNRIKEEVHREGPIDGQHAPKPMKRITKELVRLFDDCATKVHVLELALRNIGHDGPSRGHCESVIEKMKSLQKDGTTMYKRWQVSQGTYADYQREIRELDRLIAKGSGFLRGPR